MKTCTLSLLAATVCAGFASAGDRITSLEFWGKRARHDFTAESVGFACDSGFTGVLVNGGSGFGADQIPLELACPSPAFPRLAPYTVRSNEEELRRRCALLRSRNLDVWWCLWGVIGPDMSDLSGETGPSNRLFDRRSKLEMKAELLRNPEIFGSRHPRALSWRGSRPLCLSHPAVRAFYREQIKAVVSAYGIKGMVFFPGDSDPECCDSTCACCSGSGKDGYGLMIDFANDLFAAAREARPDFRMYFVVWNSGYDRIDRYTAELNPATGLAAAYTDGFVDHRPAGMHTYNQPWSNCAEAGPRLLSVAETCRQLHRPLMVLGEIAQSEVWDPLHDIPNPSSTIGLLKGARKINHDAAILDFWGMRRPFAPQANLAAMRVWTKNPDAPDEDLLLKAAALHYGIGNDHETLVREARDAWRTFEAADRSSSLVSWQQRFSYAIGRDRARGHLYRALTPAYLRTILTTWTAKMTEGIPSVDRYLAAAREDRHRFAKAADAFDRLAKHLEPVSREGAARAHNEAVQIRLAGELYGSEARALAAAYAYSRHDASALRSLIEEELSARERELALSAELAPETGLEPFLVEEDIQNMRLYLSLDSFPEADDELFSFTENPYSI